MTRTASSRLECRCRHFCCLCFCFRSSIYLFLKTCSLLCVYSLFFNVRPIECDQWEYKLIHSIMKGYDSSIRPSLHHNMTLNVTFGLALAQLIDVDERNMIITTNCWLNQGWIDHKLTWDPQQFNNIKTVHIPADRIWKPDILLVNNADAWAKTSSISTNAIVKYNGNVTWLSTVIFKSSCSINVKYFPFDEQSCDMIFASWTFDGFLLDIDVNSNEGDVTNYIKNGEWHLVKLLATKNLKHYSCCEEPYPEIFYKLIIRRRPLFYVFNMVFPCLLITLVAFLGFYLPPGSSDKVSIGITTLLSITVFLMLVAESMPPTSEQLPLLGIYYAVTIGIVSLSTAMAVITLNINNKGIKGQEVPQIVKVIFLKYLAFLMGIKLGSNIKEKSHAKSKKFSMVDPNDLAQVQRAYARNRLDELNAAEAAAAECEPPDNESTPNHIASAKPNGSPTKKFLLINQAHSNSMYDNLVLETANRSSPNNDDEYSENHNYHVIKETNLQRKLSDAEPLERYVQLEPGARRSCLKNRQIQIKFDDNSISRVNKSKDYYDQDKDVENDDSTSNDFPTQVLMPGPITKTRNYEYMCLTTEMSANICECPKCCQWRKMMEFPPDHERRLFLSPTKQTSVNFEPDPNLISTDAILLVKDNVDRSSSQKSSKSSSLYKSQSPCLTKSQPKRSAKRPTFSDDANSKDYENDTNDECANDDARNSGQNRSFSGRKSNRESLKMNNQVVLQRLKREFLVDLETLLFKQFSPLIANLTKTLNRNEERYKEKQRLEIIQNEWSDVAMILDHILCYFFSIMTLVICLLIFFNSPHVLAQW